MNKFGLPHHTILKKIIAVAALLSFLSVVCFFGISSSISASRLKESLQSILSASENFGSVVTDLRNTTAEALGQKIDSQRQEIIERLKKNDTEGLKVVFLTFDDGPSMYTAEILDILKSYNIQATFFSKGSDTELAQSVWPRMIEEGHTLANHTQSHDYDLYSSPGTFYADVQAEEDFQKSITGTEPSGLFRFPGGSLNANTTCVQGILDRGYNYVDWNVSSTDAAAVTPSPETIVSAVVEGCHGQEVSVVLCHGEVKENTRTALPTIIETLLSEGYTFLPMQKEFTYPRQLEL